jgi:hypothetical protein
MLLWDFAPERERSLPPTARAAFGLLLRVKQFESPLHLLLAIGPQVTTRPAHNMVHQ